MAETLGIRVSVSVLIGMVLRSGFYLNLNQPLI
jgi:hypothetical protein